MGHGNECEGKAWCLLLIWKKKKQGKTKKQRRSIKIKWQKQCPNPYRLSLFPTSLHTSTSLFSVSCFASMLCLLFGNAFSLSLNRFFSSSKLYIKSNPFVKLYWTIPFHRNLSSTCAWSVLRDFTLIHPVIISLIFLQYLNVNLENILGSVPFALCASSITHKC